MAGGLHIGDVLGGKYRIDELIGEGGMGVVARATHLDSRDRVAIKALRPEVRGHPDVVERFFREARAASRIVGAHAVAIHDVGRTSEGDPFMAMELLEGEDLDRMLRRDGKMSLEVAAALMAQACSGVADAHRVRIVHRDLKPSNLFLVQKPNGEQVLKVLDFGISRVDDQASQLTRTTTQLGTPHYMSPEQIERPKGVDHRTDIWALGCIFHKLLVAETPFRGQGVQIISAVLRNKRKKPSDVVPSLSAEVDAVVDRCLQPDPDKRYQTADELRAALMALIESTRSSSARALSDLLSTSLASSPSAPSVPGAPVSEHDAVTTFAPSPEKTLPLADRPSRALLQTQALTPMLSPVPRVEVTSEPSASGNFLVENTGSRSYTPSLTPANSSYTPHPSSGPGAYTRGYTPLSILHSSAPPSGRPSAPRVRRASRQSSKSRVLIGVAALLIGIIGVSAFLAPRYLGARATTAAKVAGINLRYVDSSARLEGLELRDVDATIDDAPLVKVHAARAQLSFAMETLVLDDVDLDFGASSSTEAMANAVAQLEHGALRRLEARNVRFHYDGGTIRATGVGGHFVVTRAAPFASSGERADEDEDPIQFDLDAKETEVDAFGLSLTHVNGHLEGKRGKGTILASASSAAQSLTMQATYDSAGTYVSLNAVRQAFDEQTVPLVTFEHPAPKTHDGQLALDVRVTGALVHGELDAMIYGLAPSTSNAPGTNAATPIDLSMHLSFEGTRTNLVVKSGSGRLGAYALEPQGTIDLTNGTRLNAVFESGVLPCPAPKKTEAHVKLVVDATLRDRPLVSLALPDAATCDLPLGDPLK